MPYRLCHLSGQNGVRSKAFVQWCENLGHVSFPASPESICSFLADQSASLAVSTVKRRLYAIRKIHRLLKLEDPILSEDVLLALRRVRRSKPERPRQAKGLNRPYLDRFIAAQPETPWGIRNRAMLALGYEVLARRSELVALKQSDVEFRLDGTLQVLIPRSKADPFGYGRLAFTSPSTGQLLHDWLKWRGAGQYLFCPIYKGQAIDRSLSTTSVKRLIKSGAALAGVDPAEILMFSGHSMRVGAAQDLLTAGHDTAAIMRAGGWKSIAVLTRYLESAEHNVWA